MAGYMKFVLGVDLGTSYFKLGLFNPDGELCGLGRIEVPKNVGDGSRCEVPVARFWSLLQQGVAEATAAITKIFSGGKCLKKPFSWSL